MQRANETLVFAALVLITPSAFPQGVGKAVFDRAQWVEDARQDYRSKKEEAVAWARRHGMAVSFERNGVHYVLRALEDGRPVYYKTHNRQAADTSAVDELWPFGSTGLELIGAVDLDHPVIIGLWDLGDVRLDHVEFFGGSVEDRDGSSSEGTQDHATHLAGTLVALGALPEARGMAPGARVYSWDQEEDLAEMGSHNELVSVSNHSYGRSAGWEPTPPSDPPLPYPWTWFGNPTQPESFHFGHYSSESRGWDELAYLVENATGMDPAYLICNSAGNDRGQGPSPAGLHYHYVNEERVPATDTHDVDGGPHPLPAGWDTLAPPATAKNVLTVGAILGVPGGVTPSREVEELSISSWGPTDDGRIKPDVCASGSGVFSTLAFDPDPDDPMLPPIPTTTGYGRKDGTSSATAVVSGAMALLVEHYRATHEDPETGEPLDPRGPTLKALAIHSADDAGAPGPDYKFGWGVFNAAEAAKVISLDTSQPATILEEEMIEHDTTRQRYQLALRKEEDGPAKITLVWADFSGPEQPLGALDEDTPRLVNDLDIRLRTVKLTTATGHALYEPWVLDPAFPGAPATRGDNTRDNVEQIQVDDLPRGEYLLEVYHEGDLVDVEPDAAGRPGRHRFSLITTGFTILYGGPQPPPAWTSFNYQDCNGNEVIDSLDLQNGDSVDLNGNGIPDECDGRIHEFPLTPDMISLNSADEPYANYSQGNSAADWVSSNGHHAFFYEFAPFPGGGFRMRDRQTGTTENLLGGPAYITDDGRYLYFLRFCGLLPDEPPELPFGGPCMYRQDRMTGEIIYLGQDCCSDRGARMSEDGVFAWVTGEAFPQLSERVVVWDPATGMTVTIPGSSYLQFNNLGEVVAVRASLGDVSPNGRFLLFVGGSVTPPPIDPPADDTVLLIHDRTTGSTENTGLRLEDFFGGSSFNLTNDGTIAYTFNGAIHTYTAGVGPSPPYPGVSVSDSPVPLHISPDNRFIVFRGVAQIGTEMSPVTPATDAFFVLDTVEDHVYWASAWGIPDGPGCPPLAGSPQWPSHSRLIDGFNFVNWPYLTGISRFRFVEVDGLKTDEPVFRQEDVYLMDLRLPRAQPPAVTPCDGDVISITVEDQRGFGESYQWRQNGVDLPGENDPDQLTLAGVDERDAGIYDVLMQYGPETETTTPVDVDVKTFFSFHVQPEDQLTIELSPGFYEDVSFSCAVQGAPVSHFEWTRNGIIIPGENQGTLTVSPVFDDIGAEYQVSAWSDCGWPEFSDPVRILVDLCPDDPFKTEPGICGCGVPDIDTDGDLIADCNDGCPFDENKTEPGICGCGVPDDDTDMDGTPDCIDECPNDPLKTEPGQCGCDVPDTDTDDDTVADCNDGDDDNDGVDDTEDPAPLDPSVCGDSDADGCDDCAIGTDGFGPLADADPLNDGPDADGDGFCAVTDCDDENPNAFPGATEVCDGADNDCNDLVDDLPPGPDCNANDVPDDCDIQLGTSTDIDMNGVPDECGGAVVVYCETTPNSVGPGAVIGYTGSLSISANDMTLTAAPVPNSFGLFYFGAASTQVAFGQGYRCVNGQTFRLNPPVLAMNNQAQRALDFDVAPENMIEPGSTWYFQYWYRDQLFEFNLSDGLRVVFGE